MDKTQQRTVEIIKCTQNPIYFILNYVYIPETGGRLKYTNDILHYKHKRVVRSLYRFKKCTFMASRQLGKSTIAACMIAWATVFYPGNKAVILNMKQNAALNNLNTIKFIINNLPSWMVTKRPFKSKSDIKTYVELFNNSRIDVFYPSTVHSASTLARSLTVPILYIDEAAFIRDMAEIYGSAQQTLSKARQQAIKNHYPYFILITSTPNGTNNIGKWFYDRWSHSVHDSEIFSYDEKTGKDILVSNADQIVADKNKNTFVKVKYHWSEDPSKNEKWYQEQCQELDDQRKINQELDLMFVGSTNCLFDDDTLSNFKAVKPKQIVHTNHSVPLNVFVDYIDPTDYYIIGCDTAESLTGAYCALQIYSFRNFVQVAELTYKYGSFTAYGQDIDFCFRWLHKALGNNNIILNIENNTIGKAVLEHLLYHVEDIDYRPFLYKDNVGKHDEYGTKTTGLTKPLMVGCLVEFLNENEDVSNINSELLIEQFGTIEKTNSGSITSSSYSDLFMATCFCAYLRKKKALDIMPLIELGQKEYDNRLSTQYTQILSLSNTKNMLKQSSKDDDGFNSLFVGYSEEEFAGINNDDDCGFFTF